MGKAEFKRLPVTGKVKYVIRKFGWEAVFTVYLIILLGSWIYLEYVEPEPLLSIEMIDGNKKGTDLTAFDRFMSDQGYSYNENTVKIGRSIQLGNEPGDLKVNPNHLLFCKMNMYNTDLYFWDDPDIEYSLAAQDLLDLRKLLPEEVLQSYEDRLIYSGPILKGGFPCAIHLNDCRWIRENGYYEDCAVGISKNVKNPELAIAFIRYILDPDNSEI